MPIDFQHPEYKDNIERWKLADNICSSRDVEQYLIELNPSDKSKENVTRNKQYKERAVLYAVAGHTLQGLVGLLFGKPPVIELPPQLEYMKENVDGSGISIYQQAQDSASNVIKKGRSGLFTSYPKTEGEASKADMESGGIAATINKIEAEQIANWKTETKGSKTFLSLVVIQEAIEVVEDYELKQIDQLRELALENGVFIVREWRKDKEEWEVVDESIPTDSKGSTWNEIPFTFIGSLANTSIVDDAPIYPLVKINVAHYRNSADYEDSVWYVGQAQAWMSGITKGHIDLMTEKNMYVGSREMIGVPAGEQFGFAAAPPNTMVKEAMDSKIEMLVGLGARIIQENGQIKTATESNNDAKAQYSSLGLVSANISEAYTQACKWAAKYTGAEESSIEFTATMEFISPTASAQDLQQMVAGFISGAIPMDSYLRWMKKVDLVDGEKTIEQFSEEVGQTGMTDLDSE